jgi:hypothetical protein
MDYMVHQTFMHGLCRRKARGADGKDRNASQGLPTATPRV